MLKKTRTMITRQGWGFVVHETKGHDDILTRILFGDDVEGQNPEPPASCGAI
jgi:hypothetical protein